MQPCCMLPGKLGFSAAARSWRLRASSDRADVVQDETERSVSLGEVWIERNHFLGSHGRFVAVHPQADEGERP